MTALTMYFATEKRCTISALQASADEIERVCAPLEYWVYDPDACVLSCSQLDYYIPLYELQTLSQMRAVVWFASHFASTPLVTEMCDAIELISHLGVIVDPIQGDRLPERQAFLDKIGRLKSISYLEDLLVCSPH